METSSDTTKETDLENHCLENKKENKILLVCTIISFVIAIITFLFCICTVHYSSIKIKSVMLLNPAIILFILNYFSAKYLNNKVLKILVIIFNVLVITVVQILISFFMLVIAQFIDNYRVSSSPKEYKSALMSIKSKYRIKHFPEYIPEDAQEILFTKHHSSFFGSEEFLLKFSTNEQYIDNELKRNNYISTEAPNQYKHSFDKDLIEKSLIQNDEYTFYVINDRDNENPDEHNCPYHYGIGVNSQKDKIIYYYTCPLKS